MATPAEFREQAVTNLRKAQEDLTAANQATNDAIQRIKYFEGAAQMAADIDAAQSVKDAPQPETKRRGRKPTPAAESTV